METIELKSIGEYTYKVPKEAFDEFKQSYPESTDKYDFINFLLNEYDMEDFIEYNDDDIKIDEIKFNDWCLKYKEENND